MYLLNNLSCENCARLAPVFEELAREFVTIKFLEVELREVPTLHFKESIKGTPTIGFYRNGERVWTTLGVHAHSARQEILDGIKR